MDQAPETPTTTTMMPVIETDDNNDIDDDASSAPSAPTPTPSMTTTTTTPSKKVTAKELAQFVKVQKRRLDEKDVQITSMRRTFRAKAVALTLSLATKHNIQYNQLAVLHQLKLRALRNETNIAMSHIANATMASESATQMEMERLATVARDAETVAQTEMERIATMARNAEMDADAAKQALATSEKEKKELEETMKRDKTEFEVQVRKLKGLLGKARQQLTERIEVKPPEGFTGRSSVVRTTRDPEGGFLWCLVSKPGTSSSPSHTAYEWKEESVINAWVAALPGGVSSSSSSDPLPIPFEDDLAERQIRSVREIEARLANANAEYEALSDRFEQYKRFAELALRKAEMARPVDGTLQQNEVEVSRLSAELAKVSRDRDAYLLKLEEQRSTLDTSQAAVAAMRVREAEAVAAAEDMAKKHRDAKNELEEMRQNIEVTSRRSEADTEAKLALVHSALRIAEGKCEGLERELAQAASREAALLEAEKALNVRYLEAERRCEAVTKAMDEQAIRAVRSSQQRTFPPSMPRTSNLSSFGGGGGGVTLSPPVLMVGGEEKRFHDMGARRDSAPSPRPGAAGGGVLEGLDSASVISATDDTSTNNKGSSRFFVDQMTALRDAHRAERAEWQHQNAVLRAQNEDALRRRNDLESRVAQLMGMLEEKDLSSERAALLLGGTVTSTAGMGSGEEAKVAPSASVLSSSNPADALVFLKKAVYRFITADDDSERETLLPVISTLLKFSKEETEVLQKELTPKKNEFVGGIQKRVLGVFGM